MVSFVTAASNLPDLPTLCFSSSVSTKATHIPGWIHKLTALRAIQRTAGQLHLKTSAVLVVGDGSMLHCQSLLLKERMVPRIRSSRTDLSCFKMYMLAHSSTKSTLIS